MKKKSTYVAISKTLNVFPAKIFLITLLFCCKNFSGYAAAWTTGTAGDITILTNWTNGTTSPTTFATPGDTWTVTLAMTMSSTASWVVGAAASTPDTMTYATGGSLTISGAGGVSNDTVYGVVVMNGGTLSLGGAGTTAFYNIVGGYLTFTAGTISSTGATSLFTMNVFGNYNMSGGTATTAGAAGGKLTTNVHGNFTMTGGVFNSTGAGSAITNNIYGNCSYSGASAMTCTGGDSSIVHLCLPTSSGTMLADNTSSGTWSNTNIYVDAGCTAQLDGDFSTSTSGASISTTGAYGVTVNGTLIVPALYVMNGHGIFKVNSAATLEVANTLGINGAVLSTGTRTFNTAANYVFNGTAAQVTGTYLPVALVSPDTITISNPAGVTLTQTTATTGTLLFTSGILYTTSSFTMSTPGTPGAVTGAGATSYVDGTLIKTISGFTSVNYEVGDLDYIPMNLIFSAAGTAGSLGVMTTNGLHPLVASSGILTTNIVNHYWTVTNYGASGPATVNVKGTYNAGDIIGGSNASFVTQEYTSGAWLASPLASTDNTSVPYSTTSTPGVSLATIAGDFIFGSNCTTPVITGTTTLCAGGNTPLSDIASGGTWSSSNTGVATISATGVVYGVTAGSATISYTTTCPATIVVTVGTLPISGTTTVCPGSTTNLSDGTAGGVWSSSNSAVATVSATGVVTGGTPGSANIIYTFGSCTPVSVSVTVAALGGITGTLSVCAGATTTLSDGTTGGVWSSSNSGVATIDASGTVYGASAGSTVIMYTSGSCSVSATVTVTGTLVAIAGSTSVCEGGTISLSEATAGGVWSSTNSTAATVSGTGVVYGGTATGTTTIIYTLSGCSVSVTVTVTGALTAITGAITTVCAGSTITLSDATGGGVWSSGSPGIATVSGTGVVTGVSAGTAVISYSAGSCVVTASVTVGGTLGGIIGATSVCEGSAITLSDATAGGTWSSTVPGVATVTITTGIVTGVSSGTTNISYTVGTCSVGVTITVNSVSAISGSTTVCVGSTITLSDAAPGGVWTSSSTGIAIVSGSGVVTGVVSGGTTISYTVGGCSATLAITVGNAIAAITGTTTFCVTGTTTLADGTPGGTWSSSDVTIATVSGSVTVHGVAAGAGTISYTVGGCSVEIPITVDPDNAGTISGRDTVCISGTTTALSDAVGGGVWTSSSTSHATVNAGTGVVTGVGYGVDTIKYTVTNSCGTFIARYVIHVLSASQCPTGVDPMAAQTLTELKIFPNPNGGEFTMNLLSADDEDVHVVVTNIVGEQIRTFITTTNKATDIKLNPAAGIYLLTASTVHGRYVVKVVVY